MRTNLAHQLAAIGGGTISNNNGNGRRTAELSGQADHLVDDHSPNQKFVDGVVLGLHPPKALVDLVVSFVLTWERLKGMFSAAAEDLIKKSYAKDRVDLPAAYQIRFRAGLEDQLRCLGYPEVQGQADLTLLINFIVALCRLRHLATMSDLAADQITAAWQSMTNSTGPVLVAMNDGRVVMEGKRFDVNPELTMIPEAAEFSDIIDKLLVGTGQQKSKPVPTSMVVDPTAPTNNGGARSGIITIEQFKNGIPGETAWISGVHGGRVRLCCETDKWGKPRLMVEAAADHPKAKEINSRMHEEVHIRLFHLGEKFNPATIKVCGATATAMKETYKLVVAAIAVAEGPKQQPIDSKPETAQVTKTDAPKKGGKKRPAAVLVVSEISKDEFISRVFSGPLAPGVWASDVLGGSVQFVIEVKTRKGKPDERRIMLKPAAQHPQGRLLQAFRSRTELTPAHVQSGLARSEPDFRAWAKGEHLENLNALFAATMAAIEKYKPEEKAALALAAQAKEEALPAVEEAPVEEQPVATTEVTTEEIVEDASAEPEPEVAAAEEAAHAA